MKNVLTRTYINFLSPLQALKTSLQSIKGIRWWILGLLVIAMINSYIDRGNISMAAPLITEFFNLDAEKKGWIFSSFLLGYALMQVPAGMLVDRFGIETVLHSQPTRIIENVNNVPVGNVLIRRVSN